MWTNTLKILIWIEWQSQFKKTKRKKKMSRRSFCAFKLFFYIHTVTFLICFTAAKNRGTVVIQTSSFYCIIYFTFQWPCSFCFPWIKIQRKFKSSFLKIIRQFLEQPLTYALFITNNVLWFIRPLSYCHSVKRMDLSSLYLN